MRTTALSVPVALLVGMLGLAVAPPGGAAPVALYRYDHGYALNSLKVSPGATLPVGVAAICRSGYAESVRHVTDAEYHQVYAEYGIAHRSPGQYEVDHVIPLELGGSNAVANLWPEPNDHPHGYLNSKDKLENMLHSMVCARRVALGVAQQAISSDWVAAYHRYVGTWPQGNATTRSSTTTTTPASKISATGGVVITSVSSPVAAGSVATLTARSPRADDACTLTVVLPSGRKSTAHGLGHATANRSGVVRWAWKIVSSTDPGTATATVACAAGSAERHFVIT